MSWLTQIGTVTLLNLRTIPRRLGSSTVAIVGIAGVVIVFVAVLSMAQGFFNAMNSAGSPDRALVMRSGADDEMTSGLTGPQTDIVKQAPGILRDGQRAIASAELFVIIDLPKQSTGTPANVPMRGIEATTFEVRREARIVEGRMMKFGTNEIIAGRAASHQFVGLEPGTTLKWGESTWTLVGIFEDGGSASESELWCDVKVLQPAYRRGNSYQSVYAKLAEPSAFQALKDSLTTNPQLQVTAMRSPDYYGTQTATLQMIVRTIGGIIAILMGVGAVFGAVITMYTAVASRTREIATLRALGFGSVPVVVSVLVEAALLSAVGGLLGGLAAWAAFDGYETATMNFQSFSQIAFAFRVTPALLATAMIYALIMGLFGGMLPAIRAARLPVVTALREL